MSLSELAARFELASPPAGFIDDPYPFYAALRAQQPARVLANGAVFLTRYDDVAAVYRLSQASSDKRLEIWFPFNFAGSSMTCCNSFLFNLGTKN